MRVNVEAHLQCFPKSHVTDKSGGSIAFTAIDHLSEILNGKITDYSTIFLIWISPHLPPLPHMSAITSADVVYKHEHTVIAEAIQRVVLTKSWSPEFIFSPPSSSTIKKVRGPQNNLLYFLFMSLCRCVLNDLVSPGCCCFVLRRLDFLGAALPWHLPTTQLVLWRLDFQANLSTSP